MRRYLYMFGFLLMMMSGSQVSCQDLIVTINKDSLNVKIDKETDRFVYYFISTQGNSSLVMSKKQISDIVYGFYSTSSATPLSGEDGKANDTNVTSSNAKTAKYEHIQFSGSVGYARMMVLIEDDNQFVKDFYNKLFNGFSFGFQANYMFKERLGVGFVFEQSRFENSIDNVSFQYQGGTTALGTLSEDITLMYIGSNFIFRLPFKRSGSALQFDAGFGYSTYRNIAKIAYDYEMEGETLGLSVGAAYQLNVGGGLYIPLRIGISTAVFTNLDLETASDMPDELKNALEFELENSVGISGERLLLSVGLLYAF